MPWTGPAWIARRSRSARRAEADAREALMTAMLESSLDAVVAMDHEGRVLEFNPAAERTFGYARADAIGAELAELIVPNHLRAAHRRGLERYVRTRDGALLDQRVKITAMRADGDDFPVELTITRIRGVEPPKFTGYIRDISDRVRAERNAAAQHAVASVLAEATSIDEAIPHLLRALGESMDWELGAAWLVDDEAAGLRCRSLWRTDTIEATEFRELTSALVIERGTGPLGRVWRTGTPYSSEDAAQEPDYPRAGAAAREGLRGALWMPIGSGNDVLGVIEFYSRRPNHLDDALLNTLATIGHQVGEYMRRRRAEERLAHQALHDELTGLPNRGLLLDRLGHALARSARLGSTVAVLFMDIEDFKLINDGLGHHVGDRLLVALSERLAHVLRMSDTIGRPRETVARFGGDEFVVLCEDVGGEDDALRVAERLTDELRRPAVVDGHELSVTASIGLALAAAGDATQRELRRAVAEGDLRLHYQPIVAVNDRALCGFEALVRWEHPERGLVPPAEFIPLAEDTGLIIPLGRWVIAQACAQAATWRREQPEWPTVRVSVNLSTRQLSDPELVDAVAAGIAENGLETGDLMLEITESLLMQEDDSLDMLLALKALGVRLGLDDFGTGYSSLGYLRRFPLDVLKLDRSFVSELGADAAADSIIAAVIEMARALGMEVVAEGVETSAQHEILRRLGCDQAQGYHFARPLPPAELGGFALSQ